MLTRLLPIAILVAVFAFLAFNFQTIRRDIVYKLNISGDPTTSCCDPAVVAKSDGKFDDSASIAIFNNQVIDYPKTSLSYQYQNSQALADATPNASTVLGTTTASGVEKWIEVSLKTETLTAWEGNKIVMQFPISSGLWHPTPVGTFNIWYKVKSLRMTGGDQALGTYYNLPNVPDDLFFYSGYALHGAYWHNNFGHPMSHGCVNEPLADATALYNWAGPVVPDGQTSVRATPDNPGTRVVIHQ